MAIIKKSTNSKCWRACGEKGTPYTVGRNVRLDSIKLLQENVGRTLFDIKCSKIFFDPPLREIEIKTKINK